MDNWKNECPKRGTDEDTKANGEEKVVVDKHQKKSHGETADGQCEGGATAVGRVGSNSFMVLDCQRCKYAHKITYCPGCKVTGGVNHCLSQLTHTCTKTRTAKSVVWMVVFHITIPAYWAVMLYILT